MKSFMDGMSNFCDVIFIMGSLKVGLSETTSKTVNLMAPKVQFKIFFIYLVRNKYCRSVCKIR